jgi:hypothetical protein
MTKTKTLVSIWTTCTVLLGCASSASHDQYENRYDTNGDGYLTPEEYSASEVSKLLRFEELDTDRDGLLSESELSLRIPGSGRKRSGQRPGGRGGKSRT